MKYAEFMARFTRESNWNTNSITSHIAQNADVRQLTCCISNVPQQFLLETARKLLTSGNPLKNVKILAVTELNEHAIENEAVVTKQSTTAKICGMMEDVFVCGDMGSKAAEANKGTAKIVLHSGIFPQLPETFDKPARIVDLMDMFIEGSGIFCFTKPDQDGRWDFDITHSMDKNTLVDVVALLQQKHYHVEILPLQTELLKDGTTTTTQYLRVTTGPNRNLPKVPETFASGFLNPLDVKPVPAQEEQNALDAIITDLANRAENATLVRRLAFQVGHLHITNQQYLCEALKGLGYNASLGQSSLMYPRHREESAEGLSFEASTYLYVTV